MGEVFAGRYELADPIGRGGVGAVWRAWDHRRRRYVAAKVLQQSDAHSLLRFVREQALRIDHPHVLAPASWAADDDKVLFTMDLVAGGSLVHLVGDYGPLPPVFVCTLLDQLLSGLAAVHAEGVVHRDIKPANVLLEATGTGRPRLRLSDFGIAMRLGEPRLTETNLVVGTPGYLAPEQMLGSEPDFPADLFGVGLVALYLLEGAKPDAKALVQYFAAHGTPSAPQGIPEPLWQVVASLLQPDPQARFRTATGARKALASAVELLPEPGPDDELIEIFDQLGPLPPGFGPEGPLKLAPGVVTETGTKTDTGSGSGSGAWSGTGNGTWTGTGTGAEAGAEAEAGAVGARSGVEASRYRTGDSVTPQPGTDSPAAGTGSGAGVVPVDPRQGTGSVPPLTMSDTGSFHLPPPQATVSSPQTPAPQRHHGQPEAQGQPPAQTHAQPQPQPQPQAQSDQVAPHDPAHASPYDSTHVLSSPRPHAPQYSAQTPATALHQLDHRADASTASYTAQDPQVPHSAQAIPQVPQAHPQAIPQAMPQAAPQAAPHAVPRAVPQSGPQPRHRAARPARRSGPPAKVAIPLLLLALACYAVGFWALTRI